MLSIDWRSPAAYRHAKHIPAAGFAWEYLRRNDDYRHEFQTIALTGEPSGRDLEAFADRWGLRFPMRSRRAALPAAANLESEPSTASGDAVAGRA